MPAGSLRQLSLWLVPTPQVFVEPGSRGPEKVNATIHTFPCSSHRGALSELSALSLCEGPGTMWEGKSGKERPKELRTTLPASGGCPKKTGRGCSGKGEVLRVEEAWKEGPSLGLASGEMDLPFWHPGKSIPLGPSALLPISHTSRFVSGMALARPQALAGPDLELLSPGTDRQAHSCLQSLPGCTGGSPEKYR